MKKRKMIYSVLCIVLCIVIGISGILMTNSKYTTSETGTGTTSVAKWHFDVSGTDSYSDSDDIDTINLAKTCTATTLTDGQIAPGTSGSFDIVIDASGSEVGIDYTVTFTDIPTNFPKNLEFSVGSNPYDLSTGFEGTIPANASETDKVITKTINWNWEYETEDGDEDDTDDGIADANNLTFGIEVTGTQVRPVAE